MITWEDFKKGNKLVLRDIRAWLDGDLWPWLQCLSTVLFLAVILIVDNITFGIICLIIWVIFNLFAMWRTYKLEQQ